MPAIVLRADAGSGLTSHPVLALIDTGATTSGITPSVVNTLGLLGLGKRPIGSAQGDGQAERYLFRIGLVSPGTVDSAASPFLFEAVMGFGLASTFRFDMLLGMDILSQCDFRMDPRGNALLSFG